MEVVTAGDRVRIRCASQLDDGTCLDTVADREKPYWIRAGQELAARDVSEGVLGMRIGEQKTLTIARHRHADRTLTLAVEVVAIKKG